MKLLKGNGRTLEVWNLGEAIMKLRATNAIPIKFNGWQIVDDDEARLIVRSAMNAGAVKADDK